MEDNDAGARKILSTNLTEGPADKERSHNL